MISSSMNLATTNTSSTTSALPNSLSSGQLAQSNSTNHNITQLANGNATSNFLSLLTTVQQYDSIRKWLVKNHKKVSDSFFD